MSIMTFPSSPIVPDVDMTDHAVQAVGQIAKDFEAAAVHARSVDRCRQLHERLFVIAQILADADDRVRVEWDTRLAKGED